MWICAAKVGDLKDGESVRIDVEGSGRIALFCVKGEYFAIENSCPHRGGSLVEGTVDNGEIICPWHAWSFDLKTGACSTTPETNIKTFPVKIEDNQIWIEVLG